MKTVDLFTQLLRHGASYVPGRALRALKTPSRPICIVTSVRWVLFYPHSPDERTEAQSSCVTARSHTANKEPRQDLNAHCLASASIILTPALCCKTVVGLEAERREGRGASRTK